MKNLFVICRAGLWDVGGCTEHVFRRGTTCGRVRKRPEFGAQFGNTAYGHGNAAHGFGDASDWQCESACGRNSKSGAWFNLACHHQPEYPGRFPECCAVRKRSWRGQWDTGSHIERRRIKFKLIAFDFRKQRRWDLGQQSGREFDNRKSLPVSIAQRQQRAARAVTSAHH